jgi:hypothetical protein
MKPKVEVEIELDRCVVVGTVSPQKCEIFPETALQLDCPERLVFSLLFLTLTPQALCHLRHAQSFLFGKHF